MSPRESGRGCTCARPFAQNSTCVYCTVCPGRINTVRFVMSSLTTILLGEYVSPEGIENLKGYRYAGVDHSLIYRFMLPVLNFYLDHVVPLWIAPNLLTLFGLLAMVVAYALLPLTYCPDVLTTAPRWVYAACAVCKYVYQVLDELDGKQARRTKSGSPLGELFDHGCDAVSCVLTTATIACALQLGSGWLFWTANTLVLCEFYFTLWEQYHTNFLELHYLGPNEAHVTYIALMLVSAVFGPEFWGTQLTFLGYTCTLRVWLVGALVAAGLNNFLVNLYKVRPIIASRQHPAKAAATAAYLLSPVAVSAAVSYAWVRYSPTVLTAHPVLFPLAFALLNSHQVGTLILARVTKESPRPYVWSMLPLALAAANAIHFHWISESNGLLIFAWITAILYAHFSLSVVVQLSNALKIRIFHIPYPPPVHQHETAAHHTPLDTAPREHHHEENPLSSPRRRSSSRASSAINVVINGSESPVAPSRGRSSTKREKSVGKSPKRSGSSAKLSSTSSNGSVTSPRRGRTPKSSQKL